ncbi:hematopoietic cell signal transducer [Tenrec ecaudatus]|uniref:hematopoietic cell signal transducer n=1 Tax=Tenrec ecaudatus TaxID=94439 RepID=UPI003F597399
MAFPSHILLLLLLPVASAQASPGEREVGPPPRPPLLTPAPSQCLCSGCGPLSLPLLAGLVAADAVMSLLIVGVVFVCTRPRQQPMQEDGKIYINMPGRR